MFRFRCLPIILTTPILNKIHKINFNDNLNVDVETFLKNTNNHKTQTIMSYFKKNKKNINHIIFYNKIKYINIDIDKINKMLIDEYSLPNYLNCKYGPTLEEPDDYLFNLQIISSIDKKIATKYYTSLKDVQISKISTAKKIFNCVDFSQLENYKIDVYLCYIRNQCCTYDRYFLWSFIQQNSSISLTEDFKYVVLLEIWSLKEFTGNSSINNGRYVLNKSFIKSLDLCNLYMPSYYDPLTIKLFYYLLYDDYHLKNINYYKKNEYYSKCYDDDSMIKDFKKTGLFDIVIIYLFFNCKNYDKIHNILSIFCFNKQKDIKINKNILKNIKNYIKENNVQCNKEQLEIINQFENNVI